MSDSVRKIKLKLWVAHKVPKWLVYWCAIRLGAHASCGKYRDKEVPSLTFMEALECWEKEKGQ